MRIVNREISIYSSMVGENRELDKSGKREYNPVKLGCVYGLFSLGGRLMRAWVLLLIAILAAASVSAGDKPVAVIKVEIPAIPIN